MCRKDPSPIHPSFALRAIVAEERLRQGITEPSIQQVCRATNPGSSRDPETPLII